MSRTALVCGGRNFTDQRTVDQVLDAIYIFHDVTKIVHGGARGADTCADNWAQASIVECVRVPADWAKHGKKAGPIRNQLMLDVHKPDFVIAFPGGRGTADMIDRARRAGIPVCEYREETGAIRFGSNLELRKIVADD